MNYKKITVFVALSIPAYLFIVLGYDVLAIEGGGTEASISSLLITTAYKMPFMVYCVGLLNGIFVGHLFWRMKGNKDTKELGLDDHAQEKK